jgi:hypothetical protein
MSTATIDHHLYATNDQPLLDAEHHKIVGRSDFACIQRDCDGLHHFWCSCAA